MVVKVGDVVDVGQLESLEPKSVQSECFFRSGSNWHVVVQNLKALKFNEDFGCFEVKPELLMVLTFLRIRFKYVLPTFKIDRYRLRYLVYTKFSPV